MAINHTEEEGCVSRESSMVNFGLLAIIGTCRPNNWVQ